MLRQILVVDDSTLIQQMYQVFLSRYRGVQLVTADDGAAALDALAREPEIDLILLDINMPVMNGIEFLERLQREPAYKDIPVIVITTAGRGADARRCIDLGASGHLEKPFQTPALYTLIEEITGEKPAP